MDPGDPFDTDDLRGRVLTAWSASPARFREDANAEEDLALGGYRDRVVVELAQNAADAAARAGIPGRLLLRLEGNTLVAANTGAPLDAAGVESLSTLRASAKRDGTGGTVGQFGVGFAAVLAVSDYPEVRSTTGVVRWSRDEAYDLAAGIPQLAEELAHRDRAVPVLRLPFPAEGAPPPPYDTAVVLPLRDERASALVRDLLAAVDDALLITLPGLAEVIIDVDGQARAMRCSRLGDDLLITNADQQTRWRQVTRSGRHDPATLADRPVEERARPVWSITCAVPVDDAGRPQPLPPTVSRVLHAPTPTDERLSAPVLIVATVPLDPTRRRTAPGQARDVVLAEAGAAYAELLTRLAADPAILDLVPPPVPLDIVDAAIAEATLRAAAEQALLPAADGSGHLTPRAAVLVPGLRGAADPAFLGGIVPGLVDPSWIRPGVLRRLGVREIDLADILDGLSAVDAAPDWWRRLYAAISGADVAALSTLPVPLADGRLVRGPRGALLPNGPLPERILAGGAGLVGLRIVHPQAVHPLLDRLGAIPATAAAVLANPAVQGAVTNWEVDEQTSELSAAILDLVAASGRGAAEEPWLSAMPLPSADGGWAAAEDLLLPASPVLDLLDGDPAAHTVAAQAVSRWGNEVLLAVGVRDGFGLVRDADVPLDGETWHDLDDEDGWVDATLGLLPPTELPPVLAELVAVRDLDLVRSATWARALPLLAGDYDTRVAVVEPAYVLLPDGSRHAVRPYTAWWLQAHVRVDGARLTDLCLPSANDAVQALYRPSDLDLDHEFATALGVKGELRDLLVDPDDALARLADPGRQLSAAQLSRIYPVLADADPERVDPPDRLRLPDGAGTRLVDADQIVVVDAPYWLQLDLAAALPISGDLAARLADLLDLPLADEVVAARVESEGTLVDVPAGVRSAVAGLPATVVEHDDLVVGGRSVEWWVADDVVHAATVEGLARGLAWAAGRWSDRWLIAGLLGEPGRAAALLAEGAFD